MLTLHMWWQLSKEATKPSKLLRHMETEHPALKDKPLEFPKKKKHEHKCLGKLQLQKKARVPPQLTLSQDKVM